MKSSVFDQAALERWRKSVKLDPIHLRRFSTSFLKKGADFETSLQHLPEVLIPNFRDSFAASLLELKQRFDSTRDGASKLLFETSKGHLIETVLLRIASGRTSLCVSSQAGCAVNCGFCATGKMGLKQNLPAFEILDQVRQGAELAAREGRKIRNLVFMGMGEPFQNREHLFAALDFLTDLGGFGLDQKKILISTVGILDGINAFSERYPRARLAVSLHSARDDIRKQIIPHAEKSALKGLRSTLLDYQTRTGQEIMLEYILLEGLTDQDEDILALQNFASGMRVHINLIPFNAIDFRHDLRPTSVERRQEFSRELKNRGLKVTTRYSLGSDISAACGQLAQARR
jgi:23S rRNA (adenine2503-C2)-methyltransferase